MEKRVKSPGREFTCFLGNKASVQEANQALEAWLTSLNKSGKFKARTYQNGILPCIPWPLMVYKSPIDYSGGLQVEEGQPLPLPIGWIYPRILAISPSTATRLSSRFFSAVDGKEVVGRGSDGPG